MDFSRINYIFGTPVCYCKHAVIYLAIRNLRKSPKRTHQIKLGTINSLIKRKLLAYDPGAFFCRYEETCDPTSISILLISKMQHFENFRMVQI